MYWIQIHKIKVLASLLGVYIHSPNTHYYYYFFTVVLMFGNEMPNRVLGSLDSDLMSDKSTEGSIN